MFARLPFMSPLQKVKCRTIRRGRWQSPRFSIDVGPAHIERQPYMIALRYDLRLQLLTDASRPFGHHPVCFVAPPPKEGNYYGDPLDSHCSLFIMHYEL